MRIYKSKRRGAFEKSCSKCGRVKPTTPEFFRPDRDNPELTSAQCRACENEYAKGRRLANPKPKKRRGPVAVRFWRKVNKDGPILVPELGPCWVWTGATHNGYGSMFVGKRADGGKHQEDAHRVAFFVEHGRWPAPMALHKCNGGASGCVRYDHLYEGDNADNMRDRVRTGGYATAPRGSNHPNAKLSEEMVRAMRARMESGATGASLAREYGLSAAVVSKIKRRQAWQHVA